MIKDDNKALLCNLCDMWHHINCEKVKDDIYKFLVDNEEKCLNWYCRKCNGIVRRILTTVTDVVKKQDELHSKFVALEQDMSEKIDSIRGDKANKADLGVMDHMISEADKVNQKIEKICREMPRWKCTF